MNQLGIDAENKSFWSTPCGTTAALALGLSEKSPQALAQYDEWFFSFYPYLFDNLEKPL